MKIIRLAIVICVLVTAAACSNSNNDTQNVPTESSAGSPTESAGGTPTASPTESAGESTASSKEVKITKEQYEKIENGMTYKEVMEIVGGEGEIVAESGEKGSDTYGTSVMYKGKGEVGAMASFTFVGDKLHTKMQTGLE